MNTLYNYFKNLTYHLFYNEEEEFINWLKNQNYFHVNLNSLESSEIRDLDKIGPISSILLEFNNFTKNQKIKILYNLCEKFDVGFPGNIISSDFLKEYTNTISSDEVRESYSSASVEFIREYFKSLATKFIRENVSWQYVYIFWNSELNKQRIFKVFEYHFHLRYFSNFFSCIEVDSKIPFEMEFNHGIGKIYNTQLNEEYTFNYLNINYFLENEIIKYNDILIGKDLSKHTSNGLALASLFSSLKEIKNKLNYVNLFFVINKPEVIFPKVIYNLAKFVEIIDSYRHTHKTFYFKIPYSTNSILRQFLLFFSDFVKRAKGHKIYFDVTSKEDFIIIEIHSNEDKPIEDIIDYLREYILLLNQDEDKLTIDLEIDLTNSEFNFLILELKQQILHYKQSIEILKARNYELIEDVNYFKEIVKELTKTKLLPANIQVIPQSSYQTKFLELISQNKLEKCIIELIEFLTNQNRTELTKEVITQSAKLNEVEQHKRYGTLSQSNIELRRNQIISALTDIIQKNI